MLHTCSVHKGNPITAGPQGLNALGSGSCFLIKTFLQATC